MLEHTLLHDLREQLEYTFRDPKYGTSDDILPETQAEEFASSVRLRLLQDLWTELAESAQYVESKWARFASYSVIALGACVTCLISSILPALDCRLSPASKRH